MVDIRPGYAVPNDWRLRCFFLFFKFMCLRQGRTHPFWNGRSNSSDAATQETADWEWWTLKWREVCKSCPYANLHVVGTNDESRFIHINPAWQARSRTWYAPYIHSYVRPVYRPLFGKWARASPPKRRTREWGGNQAQSSTLIPLFTYPSNDCHAG